MSREEPNKVTTKFSPLTGHPLITHMERLKRIGVTPPDPATLSDEELPGKLQWIIESLAKIRVFLSETDHLSDRELYCLLWTELLHESDLDYYWNLSCLNSFTPEIIDILKRYYVPEEERETFAKNFPCDNMPPHETPPYDRDRFLPKLEGRRN